MKIIWCFLTLLLVQSVVNQGIDSLNNMQDSSLNEVAVDVEDVPIVNVQNADQPSDISNLDYPVPKDNPVVNEKDYFLGSDNLGINENYDYFGFLDKSNTNNNNADINMAADKSKNTLVNDKDSLLQPDNQGVNSNDYFGILDNINNLDNVNANMAADKSAINLDYPVDSDNSVPKVNDYIQDNLNMDSDSNDYFGFLDITNNINQKDSVETNMAAAGDSNRQFDTQYSLQSLYDEIINNYDYGNNFDNIPIQSNENNIINNNNMDNSIPDSLTKIQLPELTLNDNAKGKLIKIIESLRPQLKLVAFERESVILVPNGYDLDKMIPYVGQKDYMEKDKVEHNSARGLIILMGPIFMGFGIVFFCLVCRLKSRQERILAQKGVKYEPMVNEV